MSFETYKQAVLDSGGFLKVPKSLIEKLGYKDSYFLSILIDTHAYWDTKHRLRKDGSFYYIYAQVREDYGLTEYAQRESIKKLVGHGLITYQQTGKTDKWYYHINFDLIEKFMTGDVTCGVDDPPKTWGHVTRPPENVGSDPMKTGGLTPRKHRVRPPENGGSIYIDQNNKTNTTKPEKNTTTLKQDPPYFVREADAIASDFSESIPLDDCEDHPAIKSLGNSEHTQTSCSYSEPTQTPPSTVLNVATESCAIMPPNPDHLSQNVSESDNQPSSTGADDLLSIIQAALASKSTS